MNLLPKKNLNIVYVVLFFLFSLFFCFLKVKYINGYYAPGIGAYGFFPILVLKHDAGFFSICLLLFLCSLYARIYSLKITLRLIITFLSFAYIVDYFILQYFFVHLTIENFLKYSPFALHFVYYLFEKIFSPAERYIAFFAILLYLLSAFKFITYFPKPNKKLRLGLLILTFSLSLFYFLPEKQEYLHSWVYKNILENNFNKGINRPYSPDFEKEVKLKEEPLNQMTCIPKIPETKNIVVVLLESFSMYHSQYFSGIYNQTPHLDRIARENTSFYNFYANGYTSEHALITTMLGVPPLPTVGQEVYASRKGAAFKRFYNYPSALPMQLKAVNYTTEFLTTGDLNFSNKGAWIKNIGFEYIEGHQHPYYNGWDRYHFESAPDEALYNRALDRIFNIQRGNPYLLLIETVSTHHPFIDPSNNTRSEKGAIIYADKQLGKFYDTLKRQNFFDSGILIILSDHHSMVPVKEAERKLYGNRTQARIPLIVSDGSFTPKKIKEHFQQMDLHSSIINFTSDQLCTSKWQGDFLHPTPMPPEYIYFVSGNDRDFILVYHKGQEGRIRLKGNKTSFVSGNIPEKELLIDKINFERLY